MTISDHQTTANTPSLTVLYDGSCPLCRREIAHYQRIARHSPLRWLDVSEPGIPLAAYGVTTEQAMRQFHVMDANGHAHIGAAGFIRLWAELPGYRWLARFCRTFKLTPLLDCVYARFADWRFKRRCREGVCGRPGPS